MNETEMLLNCYTDLQRAAVAYSNDLDSKTGKVFLVHAEKILRRTGRREFEERLKKIDRAIKYGEASPRDVADEILTLGLMIKPSFMGVTSFDIFPGITEY